jgi:hypothetical protein
VFDFLRILVQKFLKLNHPMVSESNEGVIGGRDNYDNLNLHRNKRSITLNFKDPEGLEDTFIDLSKTLMLLLKLSVLT